LRAEDATGDEKPEEGEEYPSGFRPAGGMDMERLKPQPPGRMDPFEKESVRFRSAFMRVPEVSPA
jgi:hypothetical protein